jgi:hypothetical protein
MPSQLIEEPAQHHHRLAKDWDRLVENAPELYQDLRIFLRPKKFAALSKAARSGPVVVIKVHELRCDALVLSHSRRG